MVEAAMTLEPAVVPVLEEVRPWRVGIISLAQGQDGCGETEAPRLLFSHDHACVLPDEGKGSRGRQTRDQKLKSPAPSGSLCQRATGHSARCLRAPDRASEAASRR